MKKELIKQILTKYKDEFKNEPKLVFSPGRINLIGEHTDYNDGYVFPAAIDKGIVTAIEESRNTFCTIIANDLDEKHEFTLDAIVPIENGGWRNYVIGVVAEIQKKGIELKPFNIVFGGNIPAGSGLSSSAALENSIVFALNELYDLKLSKTEMIHISQNAEHNFAGVRCGIMDQYASMFGQENTAILLDCKTEKSKFFLIHFNKYELLLINTNVTHNFSLESEYNNRRNTCELVAKKLNVNKLRDATKKKLYAIKDEISEDDFEKALYIIQENKRVLKAVNALKKNDFNAFGELLYDAHEGVRNKFKISCEELDFLVDSTKKHPQIIGSRMMGGGFGGCTINIIDKDFVDEFKKNISKSYKKQFEKDCTFYQVKLSKGTHLTSSITS